MALALLDMAYKGLYDHAFILSRDSDLAPARLSRIFLKKMITIFAPYNYRHSEELIKGSVNHKRIKYKHMATSLLLADIYDAGGNLVVRRPLEYTPPTPEKSRLP